MKKEIFVREVLERDGETATLIADTTLDGCCNESNEDYSVGVYRLVRKIKATTKVREVLPEKSKRN